MSKTNKKEHNYLKLINNQNLNQNKQKNLQTHIKKPIL